MMPAGQHEAELHWQISDSPSDPAWDQFVESSPHAHHEQTCAWGRLKGFYGWRSVRLIARAGDAIVAGVQVLERKIARVGRIGYVCHGPILAAGNSVVESQVADCLDEWGRKRYSYFLVGLPYSGAKMESSLLQRGFVHNYGPLPPYDSMDATLVLDLHQDLETIFDSFAPEKRKKLRRSYRTDLTARRGTSEDVPAFQRLMWDLCAHRGVRPSPPQRDFFERAWDEFPGGKIELLMLENSREPIGAYFSFRCGDWLRCWKVGSARKDMFKHPTERILWEAIKEYKLQGVRWFDLVSVDRDSVARLQKGEKPSAQWQPDQMTVFKLAFGGEVVLVPRQLIKIYNPILRLFILARADQLLKTKIAAALLHRVRSRQRR